MSVSEELHDEQEDKDFHTAVEYRCNESMHNAFADLYTAVQRMVYKSACPSLVIVIALGVSAATYCCRWFRLWLCEDRAPVDDSVK